MKRFILLLVALFVSTDIHSQGLPSFTPSRGDTSILGNGYVVYKEGDFLNSKLAEILNFCSYIDRTSQGDKNIGYFQFQSSSGQIMNIDVSNIIEVIPENCSDPSVLTSESALETYKSILPRLEKYSSWNGQINAALSKMVAIIKDNIDRYNRGDRFQEGRWWTPREMS